MPVRGVQLLFLGLKMVTQSSKRIQQGRSKPVKKAIADIRKQVKARFD